MGRVDRLVVIALWTLVYHSPPGQCLPHLSRGRPTRGDDVHPLEAVVLKQSSAIDQLQAQLTALTTQLTSLRERLNLQETQVAFNARLRADKRFTDNNILAFDEVDVNVGGGYDHVTGLFTAPLPGLYQFSLKISQTPPGSLHVALMTDDRQIAEVEAEGDHLDRSSSTVAIHLTKGQRVWTQRLAGSSTEAQGSYRSAFTGVLIRPDRP